MVSGEKRNCEGGNALEKTAAILLDIEGTTTSISFVKDVLFPYVQENLKDYVDSHWDDEEFKADLKALKAQAEKDAEEKLENFCPIEEGEHEKESLIKNVLWQMSLDRKATALKQLQGHIWREGYENGKLKGQVYSDVSPMLKKWCEDDRKVYVYSSGSVEAQKLLFKNSDAGDLETFLAGHFDTEVGPKTEASSYSSIAKAVGLDCNQILFLTDSVKEAVAADKAGLQTTLVIRDGNTPLTDDEKKAFTTVTSFKDLVLETSNKKKKMCDEGQETETVENVETVDKSKEVKNGDGEKMEVEGNNERETEKTNENETAEVTPSGETNEEVDENIVVDEGEETGEKVVTSSVEGVAGDDAESADKADAEETVSTPKTVAEVTKETNGETVNGHEKNGVDETKGEVAEEANGSEATDAEPVVKKTTSEEQVDSTVEVTA